MLAGIHIAVEGELLAFEVAGTSMAAAEPGHVAFRNRFARLIIDALPLEVDNFPSVLSQGP